MKRFVVMIFVGFTSFCIAQKNYVPLEFVSETNEAVLLTPMNDSLKIEYPKSGVKTILFLNEDAMEVEGSAFYVGVLKRDSSNCEITVQFLEETECVVDSDCELLSKGICKLEVKKLFQETGSGAPYARKMIQKPNTNGISTDENCVIVLRINVDPEGNVVGIPSSVRGQTTTTNLELIRKVIEVVKKEAKYAKANGKAMESMTIRIKLNSN